MRVKPMWRAVVFRFEHYFLPVILEEMLDTSKPPPWLAGLGNPLLDVLEDSEKSTCPETFASIARHTDDRQTEDIRNSWQIRLLDPPLRIRRPNTRWAMKQSRRVRQTEEDFPRVCCCEVALNEENLAKTLSGHDHRHDGSGDQPQCCRGLGWKSTDMRNKEMMVPVRSDEMWWTNKACSFLMVCGAVSRGMDF
jgi:hypothetical protein